MKTPIGDHQDGQGSLPDNQEKLIIKIELSKDRYVSTNLSIPDNDERMQKTYTINKSKKNRVEPDTNFHHPGTVLKDKDIVIKRV